MEENSINLKKNIVKPDWLLSSPTLGACLLNHLFIDISIYNHPN
jgi:hypothetical protein